MHKWYTAGKGQVESTRQQADIKQEDKKAKKNHKLLKSKKTYWKDCTVVPDISYLICQDIKKKLVRLSR
jgi:hypothetical protein